MVATGRATRGGWRSWLLRFGTAIAVELGLAGGPVPSWGSDLVTRVGDYTIQNWQVEQGLPQISITAIAQTPDGYLWLGTFNGLVRFDGVRFTVFDEGNTPVLGSSAITQLQVDEQGALWIVTLTGGLVRMAAGQFTAALKPDEPLLLGGGEFCSDPKRRLLLRDRRSGWWQIENGQLVPPANTAGTRAEDEPRFLFENSGGTWLLQEGKLSSAAQKTRVFLLAREGSKSNRVELVVSSAAASQAGGYWLATESGIYRLGRGRVATWVAPLPSGIGQPMSLKEDGQTNLWAGKWGAGVYRLAPDGSWQKFGAGTGLADNYVNCLFRDREGSLWVGTGQGGLYRFRPRVFHMYDTEGRAGSSVVMSVTQDRQGRMWCGVNGEGLQRWSGGQLEAVTEPAPFGRYPLVYSVLADRQEALWVGLYGMKVLRWQEGTVTAYDLGEGSGQPMTPQALFEDHQGTIWLGCTHGLMAYESGQFRRYGRREGLSCDTVVALAEDGQGRLYAGTDGGGLNCLRQGRFVWVREEEGLADNHVTALYMDKEGTLWIGTLNGGLSRLKGGQPTKFSVRDGLASNTIGSVLEDDLGNLWLGSNRGIVRVSRAALDAYAAGERRSLAWRVFGLADGLSTIGCTVGSQPASWKAQDGKLWFATVKGVAVVDPNHLPFNPLAPPVVIEEVVMDDQVCVLQSGKAALRAPARVHRLEFRFTGLSLVAPEEVRFRYRLEPFDHDWIEAGTRRVGYYTGIPPGRYEFRVTACNNDGVWNETGSGLVLEVPPPWWRTWWFKLLAAIAVGGTFFGWHEQRLWRVRRERALQESFARQLLSSQENERRRIAGDLHDGLGQNLVLIRNRAELGLRQLHPAPAVAEQLQEISQAAAQSLEEVRATAHALRPYELERLGLIKAIENAAQKAGETSGVKFACDLERIDGVLTAEAEMALFRILQEGISNVLRHAQAREVIIELKREADGMRLTILDDGRGFDLPGVQAKGAAKAGFGLRNIAARAKLHGGKLRVESAPGRGTALTVHLPIQREFS